MGPHASTGAKGRTVTELIDIIDTHLAAYAEPDPVRRRGLIIEAWRPDGRLVEPPMDAEGHDAIHEMAGTVQDQFPGAKFHRVTSVDGHHGYARYGWELVTEGRGVVLAGTDVVRVGEDGRLAGVLGFFGDIPDRPGSAPRRRPAEEL